MRPYKAYIFDLDGTLFRGDEPIDGAVETVLELERRGAIIRYLTNNSTRTREFFTDKLRRMGYPASPEEVYTSGLGTAKFLSASGVTAAFVVGEEGLKDTIRAYGIHVRDADVQAVVVGLSKQFTYELMNQAMQLIRSGARFIATNPDPTYPVEGGGLIPGAGSVVAAVRTCSEQEPFVVGKPNPYLVELVMQESNLSPAEVLVVGDRLDTDLESGARAGCDTFLVLSGVTEVAPNGQAHAEDLRGMIA